MKRLETNFLSQLLYWIINVGIAAMGFAIVALPWVVDKIFSGSTFYRLVPRSKLFFLLYVTSIPAWVILWMTRRLAKNIIERDPFSKSSTKSLKVISICALLIFLGYFLTCVLVQATFGFIVVTVGSFMVALIAAILYRLVDLAIEIKEENELTI